MPGRYASHGLGGVEVHHRLDPQQVQCKQGGIRISQDGGVVVVGDKRGGDRDVIPRGEKSQASPTRGGGKGCQMQQVLAGLGE